MFNNIKKIYKSKKYEKFFKYFSNTWLGNRIPKTLWNYNDLLINPSNIAFFYLTNNVTENINRYLNSKLKIAICSSFLFRESILDIITQFKIKTSNSNQYKKKSEILDFYIKRVGDENANLISKEDYDKIKIIFEQLEFPNVNKKYVETQDGEVEIMNSDSD